MVFADLNFLFLFFPVFLGIYFLFPNRTYRNTILLIFSLFFYAWGEPVYIVVMIFSVVLNYFIALKIGAHERNRKFYMFLGVACNLLLLTSFKYLDFLISNINLMLNTNIQPLKIPLPIGISFYTFHLITYLNDIYSGRSQPQKNMVILGGYVAAFPQLVAGPIVRYHTISDEFHHRTENIDNFVAGIRRFIVGLSKKVIIANNMAFIADTLLKELPENYGAIGAWIILLSYSIQIYYDFSGYSDMAVGIGRMLGFHYLENFNYPYIARSITDFWRRWHISLTTFFRDYVYIPLGGNRVHQTRWLLNILFIWCLTGLWHGAKWNYILWGLYYGIILIIEKTLIGKNLEKLPAFVSRSYVIFFTLLGWALFRIEDISELKEFLRTLLGVHGCGFLETFIYTQTLQLHYILLLIIGIVFCTPLAKRMESYCYRTIWGSIVADSWLIILFIISIFLLIVGSYNPFIYFRF